MRGLDCLLSINGNAVAAQINASLDRATSYSDVTNRIKLDWEESLPGYKNWSVTCQGAYVTDDDALSALEDAFIKGLMIDIELSTPNKYKGKGYIISFPIGAVYNKDITYTIKIKGTGALERV